LAKKYTSWTFKHNSTEEIESITRSDHAFPDSNEANNVWSAAKDTLEKTLYLDDYLGVLAQLRHQ
jgi:hypothetical protein